VKALLVAALVLASAVLASAEQFNIPLISTDANGIRVTDLTFNHIEGDSLKVRVAARGPAMTDTVRYKIIDPVGYPAWLNYQFKADSASLTAWFRFYELDRYSINATAKTGSWSDWIPVFLNGNATAGSFQVGLWDSVLVQVTGSGNAMVEMSWSAEVMGD
jgi:hypothetical protein